MAASKDILDSTEAQRARAGLKAIHAGHVALGAAHLNLDAEIKAAEKRVREKRKALGVIKDSTAKDAAKTKTGWQERTKRELAPVMEAHRRISGLLDELLARMHRVKDTLA